MASLAFETAFGVCTLSWSESGITRFMLPTPDSGRGETASALAEAIPSWIRDTTEKAALHLAGSLQDFSSARLDWSIVGDFQRAVYRATQRIPPGQKASYGDISRSIGLGPESARGVGAALASNPWPLLVPCHRVVSRDGRMTGFSAPGGVRTKTRLLVLEGAELVSD